MKNADSPAHPFINDANPEGEAFEIHYGITKREYFITHAPTVIPDWFEPTIPAKPKDPERTFNKFGKGSHHKHKDLFKRFYDDENDVWVDKNGEVPQDFKNEVAAHTENVDRLIESKKQWDKLRQRERDIQWPIFWADETLNKLEG